MITAILIAAAQSVLTVFAASSLHAALPEIAKAFKAGHPDIDVRFSFAGSQLLEEQLVEGAPADVYASADSRWMHQAVKDNVVLTAVPFAANTLVIAASEASTVRVPADLAKPGLRIVLCADAVPCGRYTRESLEKMAQLKLYGRGFASAVLRNIVSMEDNVESVLTKVRVGEADAGFVYASDVVAPLKSIRRIELPPTARPAIEYDIAVVRTSSSRALAAQFVDFVRSPQAQAILHRIGFVRF